MCRNSLFFIEDQIFFWRLSRACGFPVSMTSNSSSQDPAHPHWNKPKPFLWHGEKGEQGPRALHFSRTNWASLQQHGAQASRRTTALGTSDRPRASTHFSGGFQVVAWVCSHQHLLESPLFPHSNMNFPLEQLHFFIGADTQSGQ